MSHITSTNLPVDTSEIGTYHWLIDNKYAEIAELLADLPGEALLWKPFEISPWQGPAGSLGWLIAHAISSTIYLVRRAEWIMDRIDWSDVAGDEGEEEFGTASQHPAYLLARAEQMRGAVHRFLNSLSPTDLEVARTHPLRPNVTLTARRDTQHAIEHLSQHIGHAQLTRQLWALEHG